MSTLKNNSNGLLQALQSNLRDLQQQLESANLTQLARQSGFLQRLPRKIPILKWVLAFTSLSAETTLSLERIAAVISLAAGTSYSKQALHQRLGSRLEAFLTQIAAFLFRQVSLPVQNKGWFASFGRVLVQDSTVQALPDHLASLFPGSANARHRASSALKIQLVYELLRGQVLRFSLSGFRRNDQAASPDILEELRPGDLVIRDLGYFSTQVFQQIIQLGAYFLSRLRQDVKLYDPTTGQEIDLAKVMRPGQIYDRQVWVGAQHMPARLVAVPVSEALANERRARARNNRDKRLNPSARRLYLLAWNMFLTNVPLTTWPPEAFVPLYRLRWRIEIIFKMWKSHLRFRELNCRTAEMLRLSVLTKLLFCFAAYRFCDSMELQGAHQGHVSLLRLARILGQCASWFAATILGLSQAQWVDWHLQRHLFYEKRKDRQNYYEMVSNLRACLT